MNFRKTFFSLVMMLGIVLLLFGCGIQVSENENAATQHNTANNNPQKKRNVIDNG